MYVLTSKLFQKRLIHFIQLASKLVEKLPVIEPKFDFNFFSKFYVDKCVFPDSFPFSIVSEP